MKKKKRGKKKPKTSNTTLPPELKKGRAFLGQDHAGTFECKVKQLFKDGVKI